MTKRHEQEIRQRTTQNRIHKGIKLATKSRGKTGVFNNYKSIIRKQEGGS